MRRVIVAVLLVTMLGAGGWTAVYLYRWEWSRALWTSMVFVAAEVAVATLVILRRLSQLTVPPPAGDTARVRARLAEHRPTVHRFAWLEDMTQRTNVFVTLVVGGGLLVSGVLWIFDKVAERTLTPVAEQRLAERLGALSLPAGGLVPDESMLFAAELGDDERADLSLLLTGRREPGP